MFRCFRSAFNVLFAIFFQNSNVFWSDSLQAELIWEGGGRNLGTPTIFNESSGGSNEGIATKELNGAESGKSSPAPIKIEPDTKESSQKEKQDCEMLSVKKEPDSFGEQDMLLSSSDIPQTGVKEPHSENTEPPSGILQPPTHLAEKPQLGIVYMEDIGMKYAPNMTQDISALSKSK